MNNNKKPIKNSKFNRNKPKEVQVSPGKNLLFIMLKSNVDKLKEVSIFVNNLRTNIKILKDLIKEVK